MSGDPASRQHVLGNFQDHPIWHTHIYIYVIYIYTIYLSYPILSYPLLSSPLLSYPIYLDR
jgi:hypothetical protein